MRKFVSSARRVSFVLWKAVFLLIGFCSIASRADQIVYNDMLQNGWQDWSWATVNTNNPLPVHTGSYSISATCNNSSGDWKALYLSVPAMDSSTFTNLSFWINGGTGGQQVQAQAILGSSAQSPIHLGKLPTNSWKQINLSLTALGAANKPNFTGFWLQGEGSSPLPTFYVDDIVLQAGPPPVAGTNAPVTIRVDALADRHAISPLIYGVAFADSNQLSDLNVPLNRSGGNTTTRHNWQINASGHAGDWYFQSIADTTNTTPGIFNDEFIRDSKNGGTEPMLTIPILGWVAKLGPNRSMLWSYSISKYGPQTDHDYWWPDSGNGIGTNPVTQTSWLITSNNPTDANINVDTNFQAGWVQHLTNIWSTATNGGLRYYLMDNEWSIWHGTHRDVHPIGATMDEVLGKFCDYSTMIKGIDPGAIVAGPEEWGWSGYFLSGYDQQYGSVHGWNFMPDQSAHGGQDFAPWFLNQVQQRSAAAGKRLMDVFTLHFYPQGGEALGSDVSPAMQLRRNRSTRALWDTNYVDETWINDKVMLIPRMKNWVATNYPGTLTGITEYNWGADNHMNGATAQADVLGIFGREGLDLATRWVVPSTGSPAYNAFKIFRNYDGAKSTFGQLNVRAVATNSDVVAAFAAIRTNNNSLTIVLINKDPVNASLVRIALTNYPAVASAKVWRLASNVLARVTDAPVVGNVISNNFPAQSVSLLVLTPSAPALQLENPDTGGQSNLRLDGVPGVQYLIQSSSNLANWIPFVTNTLATNWTEIPVSTLNPAQRFFRAVWQ
jgi:hypothetical protein